MKFSTLFLALTVTGASAFAPQAAQKQTFATSTTSALSAIDDKTEVREYFNTEGFNRWNKIYSDSDEVNKVQMDIRDGHGQTIQKILNWVQADGDIAGKSVCDCGCGVGSLAIPLAQMGTFLYTYIVVYVYFYCCCLLY
jgi:magnesium-protoporphyrin O-methyltransferase